MNDHSALWTPDTAAAAVNQSQNPLTTMIEIRSDLRRIVTGAVVSGRCLLCHGKNHHQTENPAAINWCCPDRHQADQFGRLINATIDAWFKETR